MKAHCNAKRLAALLAVAALVLCCLLALLRPRAVTTAAPVDGAIPLPVVMYHHVLGEDSSLLGDYVISCSELESDLAWLKASGYQTISLQQLLDYVDGKGDLPPRPVLLTFDDGYESFYANAYPLLQKYQANAVVSVIGRYSDLYSQPGVIKHLNYSHLNWDQVRELDASPLVEIGNHSYDRHDATGKESPKGAKPVQGQGEENYRQAFQQDTEKNQQALAAAVSQAPVLYAYPFGLYTNASEEVLKAMGYRITLTCEERVNWITRDPDCLYLLGRFNRPHGIRSADFFAPGGQGPAAITGSTTSTAVQMGPAGPGR